MPNALKTGVSAESRLLLFCGPFMCGRYTISRPEGVPELFEVSETRLPPRFNIAPTQEAPVVRLNERTNRELAQLRWGLVPYWSSDGTVTGRMINARSESLLDKPAFRDPFRFRRCLVPADGFFEWATVPGQRKRQPYHFHLSNRGLFALAGLWDGWTGPDERLETFAIITCAPNEIVRAIHDRMPVILPRDSWEMWLSPETPLEHCQGLLVPFPSGNMDYHRVTTAVNSPAVDDPSCVLPLEEDKGRPRKGLFDSL